MSSANVLEPGDLILVKSHGRLFAFGRWLGGNPYDHVAVVVGNGQTINIDKPRTRQLPLERLLRASHEPLVLRPAWPSAAARDRFVQWIERLAGREYDVQRTLRLIGALIAARVLHLHRPLRAPHADQPKWICTDAVLLGLEQFAGADLTMLELDWNRLRCATTNDLLTIRMERPDLLREIPALQRTRASRS